jgi:hypothetical protein
VSRVPNVYHFVFGLREQTEPFHLMHYLCLASCAAVNRPEAIVFHYVNEPWGPLWERIRPALTLRRIEPDARIAAHTYTDPALAPFRYAHLADVARLEALEAFGGVYADMDTLFVAPLPEAFFAQPCVMGRERLDDALPSAREAGGSLCNAWILAEPGAAFVKAWRARLHEAFGRTWSDHSTFLPYRLALELPHAIHIEPERSFFHYDWTREGLRRLFLASDPTPEGVYSCHLWAHLWWARDRRDFSPFHAGRLTPAYVRHADTPYARLARPFLPADLPGQDAATWRREARAAAVEDALGGLRHAGIRLVRRLAALGGRGRG